LCFLFLFFLPDDRKAFISRADVRAVLPFRPEEYADLAELQALVRLVGPYGVRAIHRETMKFVASNIAPIKEVLALNRKTLSDINANYSKDVTVHLKALREVDTFINRSIAIGNALQFRQLLLEAQRSVADKDMPFLAHAVDNIFDQVRLVCAVRCGVCACVRVRCAMCSNDCLVGVCYIVVSAKHVHEAGVPGAGLAGDDPRSRPGLGRPGPQGRPLQGHRRAGQVRVPPPPSSPPTFGQRSDPGGGGWW
jgi:hypothetical protein